MRHYTKGQKVELYKSLRTQYLSDRPMGKKEEETMWNCWYDISKNGQWKLIRIKNSQIRN